MQGVDGLLSPGDCFLLTPDMFVSMENRSAEPLCYYELTFERMSGLAAEEPVSETFPYSGKLHVASSSQLIEQLQRMIECQQREGEPSGLDSLRDHIRFQELLYLVLEQHDLADVQQDSILAVQKTIEELQRDYREPVKMEQLARKANIGVWQYRQLFKRLTGRNPNEYIAELRINQAKNLLLVSKAPLAEIARSVGYQDEYYFNRKFSKIVGASPRQYIRSKQSGLRVAAFTHFGDMMSLGMQPLAVDSHILHWLDAGYTKGIEGIEASMFGLDKLAELRPDLILVNGYTEPAFANELKRIAPTVELETGNGLFQQLQDLAGLLGKQHEAKAWLKQYETKARQVQELWKPTIGKKETAIVFHVVDQQLYLYSPEEFPVLYDVLGFEAPDHLTRLRAERTSRLFVPAASFADYAADRIFIIVGGMKGARETFEQVVRSPQWRALAAVQSNRVYYMQDHWALDGTIAIDWQLDGISDLLAKRF